MKGINFERERKHGGVNWKHSIASIAAARTANMLLLKVSFIGSISAVVHYQQTNLNTIIV